MSRVYNRYHFGAMDIGDVMQVARKPDNYDNYGKDRTQQLLQVNCRNYGKRHGVRFSTKLTPNYVEVRREA